MVASGRREASNPSMACSSRWSTSTAASLRGRHVGRHPGTLAFRPWNGQAPAVQSPPVPDPRADRLAFLAAYEAALTDPVRLVTLLTDAEDDDDAVRRVQEAFDLPALPARAVLDMQFGRLSRASRARISDELRILRQEWGADLPVTVAFTSRRRAVVTVDDDARTVTGTGAQAVLDRVTEHLVAALAVPQLRPVVAEVTGHAGALVRIRALPSWSASYEYAGDSPG
jgi:hypothetical protein